jgi:hypothetical protein
LNITLEEQYKRLERLGLPLPVIESDREEDYAPTDYTAIEMKKFLHSMFGEIPRTNNPQGVKLHIHLIDQKPWRVRCSALTCD